MKTSKKKHYLTPNEVGELLMVSPITVRQWAQKGMLSAFVTAGGHRRFLLQDIERFARERGLTLQHPVDEVLRVLVVDDDPAVRGLLVELLESVPEPAMAIETAVDGFDAGRKVQSFEPHVMLLDIMMPGLNGIEVCQGLKNDPASRSIRIVAITGHFEPENVQRIIDAGAEACLAKPVDRKALIEALGVYGN